MNTGDECVCVCNTIISRTGTSVHCPWIEEEVNKKNMSLITNLIARAQVSWVELMSTLPIACDSVVSAPTNKQ